MRKAKGGKRLTTDSAVPVSRKPQEIAGSCKICGSCHHQLPRQQQNPSPLPVVDEEAYFRKTTAPTSLYRVENVFPSPSETRGARGAAE